MQFDLTWLGYLATSLFTLSFVLKQEIWLLRLQMTSASLWIVYGALRGDNPVILANVLVAGASLFRQVRMAMAASRARRQAVPAPINSPSL